MNKYIAVIVSLLLTACSGTEEFFQGDDSGKTPMSLTFGLSGAENGVTSRAVVSSFGTSDEIGVCLRSGASTATYDGTAYENMEYKTSDGSKVSGSKPLLSANTGYIYAYYPYASGTSITAVSMSSEQTDYMYGSAATTSDADFSAVTCDDHNATKTVCMHHAKALLKFTLTRGTFTGTGKVTAVSASGSNIAASATLDATAGTLSNYGTGEVKITSTKTIGSTTGNSITEDMLVVSKTTDGQNITVAFTVDGKVYNIYLTSATIKNQYQTNVSLTLDDTGLKLNSVGISAWTTTSSILGAFGYAAHEYVEIGGLKWATMNLGATTVADSPETSYGDYYAWGEIDTYYDSYTPPTGTSGKSTDITWKEEATKTHIPGLKDEYSWKNYCGEDDNTMTTEWDPAPYSNDILLSNYDAAHVNWGGGWRMPTVADFESLFNACTGGTTVTVSTASSYIFSGGVYWVTAGSTVNGVTYNVQGMLFVSLSDMTKKVFFPATGLMTSLLNINGSGNYWASKVYTTFGHAYELDFESKSCKTTYAQRRYGFSIRPVSE